MQTTYPKTTSWTKPYPDDAAQEMALLGSSYPAVRVSAVRYAAIREVLESEIEENLKEVDPKPLLRMLEIAPGMLLSEEDLFEDLSYEEMDESRINMMISVERCRKVARCMLALRFLEQKQDSMIRAGRLIGDAEFSARMQGRGPDADLWLSASLKKPGEVVLDG